MLFGLVATSFGKSDAAQKATSLLNDPAIAIVNRIRIDPTLIAANGAPAQPAQNADSNGAAGQTPPPPQMGGVQDYESQNRYSAYQQGQPPYPRLIPRDGDVLVHVERIRLRLPRDQQLRRLWSVDSSHQSLRFPESGPYPAPGPYGP